MKGKQYFIIAMFILIGILYTCKLDNYFVERILITKKDSNNAVYITDKKQIKMILNCLNTRKRQLKKFLPMYYIDIQYQYKKDKKRYLVNKNYVKIDGITYKLKHDLEEVIINIINN